MTLFVYQIIALIYYQQKIPLLYYTIDPPLLPPSIDLEWQLPSRMISPPILSIFITFILMKPCSYPCLYSSIPQELSLLVSMCAYCFDLQEKREVCQWYTSNPNASDPFYSHWIRCNVNVLASIHCLVNELIAHSVLQTESRASVWENLKAQYLKVVSSDFLISKRNHTRFNRVILISMITLPW